MSLARNVLFLFNSQAHSISLTIVDAPNNLQGYNYFPPSLVIRSITRFLSTSCVFVFDWLSQPPSNHHNFLKRVHTIPVFRRTTLLSAIRNQANSGMCAI